MATTLPSAATKAHLDEGTDDPKQARTELAALVDAVNGLRTALGQLGLLDLHPTSGLEIDPQDPGTPNRLKLAVPVPVAFGGTGATDAEGAREELELVAMGEEEAETGEAEDARLISAAVLAAAIAALAPSPKIAIFRHVEASGTGGGTATSGGWEKRTLNDTQVNQIAGASVSSSVITLAAGTYRFGWSAVAYNTTRFQTRLSNTTDTEHEEGLVVFPGRDGGGGQQGAAVSTGEAVVTVASETTFELQQQVGETTADDGYGIAASFGPEVYATMAITRLAG